MAKPSRASRKATARPMPPEAPVMRAVLVGELVMRDLLSWFGVASLRARAVFIAPASSRPCPADQHERVETALSQDGLWEAQGDKRGSDSQGLTRLDCRVFGLLRQPPTGGLLTAVGGVPPLWSSRTTYAGRSCSRRIHSRM